jgi:predicted lipase
MLITSFCYTQMLMNGLNSQIRMYTYGQPRTGNGAYAEFVNTVVGVNNVYRSVHGHDVLAPFHLIHPK